MAGFGLFALLYIISLFLYLSNKTAIPSIDTIPARYLSLSLLRDGDLNLDEYKEQKKEIGILATREYKGHLLSDFLCLRPFLSSLRFPSLENSAPFAPGFIMLIYGDFPHSPWDASSFHTGNGGAGMDMVRAIGRISSLFYVSFLCLLWSGFGNAIGGFSS